MQTLDWISDSQNFLKSSQLPSCLDGARFKTGKILYCSIVYKPVFTNIFVKGIFRSKFKALQKNFRGVKFVKCNLFHFFFFFAWKWKIDIYVDCLQLTCKMFQWTSSKKLRFKEVNVCLCVVCKFQKCGYTFNITAAKSTWPVCLSLWNSWAYTGREGKEEDSKGCAFSQS